MLLQVAKGVENALEDGYIEREIQLLYGGLAATELATLNDLLLEDMKSFGEQLSDGVKPFFVMEDIAPRHSAAGSLFLTSMRRDASAGCRSGSTR